jgi:hypothetical protein
METHRQEILLLLSSLKVNSEVNTILGLDKALGAKTQLKIRDDLAKFLRRTSPVDIISLLQS